jgi:HEPN domain-containing protein
MHPLTLEWVDKAEGDYGTLLREFLAGKNYDAVCFHAQQCAEKYLKALLQENNIPFQRTHDLVSLLRLLTPFEPDLGDLLPASHILHVFAVNVRYPGEDADEIIAQKAIEHCDVIRSSIRKKMQINN